MNNLHIETSLAMTEMVKVLTGRPAPLSLVTIVKLMPDHREDAVRMAFWSLTQEGRIKLNKQYRASLV